MDKNTLLPVFLAACLTICFTAFGLGAEPARSSIDFTLANSSLVNVGGMPYLSLDVMASGTENDPRLGTGIVYLNYNPQVFGQNVKQNSNVIVEIGTLLSTSPFPLYNLIINDNTSTRLAVTFEYLFTPGGGSLLTGAPQRLLNLRFRVLNFCHASGISFQQNLMQGEQYKDDNSTLFYPVTASDTENDVVPAQPSGLAMAVDGGVLSLNWQECPGCVYTVYSAAEPLSCNWQIEAAGLAVPHWDGVSGEARKFYRVTATGLPGR